jgi:serine-type D-Ala-D-Ala carboxypeptidase/endopeptidase (penicillin-binding protein 4)
VLATLLLVLAPTSLAAILDDPKLDGAVVAAQVARADGSVLFERNPAMRVVPASNQKLLSGAFALHKIGADWAPETRIWKFQDRVVVDTTGDPMLTYAQLVDARNRLALDGSLPVHVRQPYAPGVPPSWEHDDLPNRYASQVTAFTVDRGSFELWSRGGRPVLEPFAYDVQILHSGGSGNPRVVYDPFERRVTVTGQMPQTDARLDTLALPRPDLRAAMLLGSSFVTTNEVPTTPPTLVIRGNPVRTMLPACLQPSDNQIAEHFLLLGGLQGSDLGTRPYEVARGAFRAFLTGEVGMAAVDVQPFDGSGMSRHNLVTARGIVRLLRWAATQPTSELWKDSLARPGTGTLANRMRGLGFQGKTGTLNMVSALSGYVRHDTGEELVVSLVMNNYACTAAEARAIQDAFMNTVSKLELPAREVQR